MQQQVENRDEETLELKETYSSLQQEVDIKTKKLKKVAHLLPLEPKPLLVSIDSFNQCFFIVQSPIIVAFAIQIAVST